MIFDRGASVSGRKMPGAVAAAKSVNDSGDQKVAENAGEQDRAALGSAPAAEPH